MAQTFTPRFVDLVRNTTSIVGTGNFVLGSAVPGFTSFASAIQPGDSFYYSCIGTTKPSECEVGRGTMQADGTISRDPISGTLTDFSGGAKTIALITAAEWYTNVSQASGGGTPVDVADRTALAAADSRTSAVRVLREKGREGLFLFEASDLSGPVAADPRQGVYVAPSSDVSGRSGAWVRAIDHCVNVKWFGAKGDGATDDGAAFAAAIAFLKATAVNLSANGFYKGSPRLSVSAGHYLMGTTTLDITHTLIIEGEGSSGATTSKLEWADGCDGIRIQRYNTSAESNVDAVTHTGGDNATLRGLYLLGGYAGTESECHAVHAKARVVVEDCLIESWSGDGVYCNATAGSGGANEGNANCSIVSRVIVQGCRNGFNLDGADENVWNFVGCQANSNRAWGFRDSNFLGNSYFGCHTSANGWLTASVPTACSYAGNRYMVVPGQEPWCSVNPPTGTAVSNQGWLWLQAGGASATFKDWVSGTAFRSGGGYFSDSINAQSVYVGCYAESDQNPAYIAAPALVIGGQYGFKPFGNALYLRTDTGGLLQLGPQAGTTQDYAVHLNCTSSYNKLLFRSWIGGVGSTDATLWSIRNGPFILDAPQGLSLRFNGAATATVTGSAIDLASGKVLKADGTQVVGARKTGWAVDTGTAKRSANATYTAGPALTFGSAYNPSELAALAGRMAAVEAALQDATQTQKALKDDLHATAGHGLIGT